MKFTDKTRRSALRNLASESLGDRDVVDPETLQSTVEETNAEEECNILPPAVSTLSTTVRQITSAPSTSTGKKRTLQTTPTSEPPPKSRDLKPTPPMPRPHIEDSPIDHFLDQSSGSTTVVDTFDLHDERDMDDVHDIEGLLRERRDSEVVGHDVISVINTSQYRRLDESELMILLNEVMKSISDYSGLPLTLIRDNDNHLIKIIKTRPQSSMLSFITNLTSLSLNSGVPTSSTPSRKRHEMEQKANPPHSTVDPVPSTSTTVNPIDAHQPFADQQGHSLKEAQSFVDRLEVGIIYSKKKDRAAKIKLTLHSLNVSRDEAIRAIKTCKSDQDRIKIILSLTKQGKFFSRMLSLDD